MTFKVLFATDLHGSTMVMKKVLGAARYYEVDMVIIGGDLSGKRLVPIERLDKGKYRSHEPYKQKDDTGKAIEAPIVKDFSESERAPYLQKLESKGYYWLLDDSERLLEIGNSAEQLDKAFENVIFERIMYWAKLVNEGLESGVTCIWSGGNDDDPRLLSRVTASDLGSFQYGENHILRVQDYEVLSLGFSNKTRFHTSRELGDDELFARLEALYGDTKNADNLLLNVHVPPNDCGTIDMALDGNGMQIHVGSSGVREFINRYQPLAHFAGHVHEGKGVEQIGRTTVFNPGSDYNSGVLQTFVVSFRNSKVIDYIHDML